MAKSKKLNPLLPLAALGAGLFALLSSKSAAAQPGAPTGSSSLPPGTPGTTTLPGGTVVPAPSLPATTPPATGTTIVPFSTNGHDWELVPITGQGIATVDVYAPAGSSWGNPGRLRVCRFTQISSNSPRVLAGVAESVPKTVLDAAIKDLSIVLPQTTPAPTQTTPAGRPPMPSSLQQEMVAVMTALGVDAGGVVRGPVTVEGVQRATELSSRLEQAGYPEAAAAMRSYAQQASKLLPPPANPAPPLPGVPVALMTAIQQALERERDPAKLDALRAALLAVPQSAERDMLIGALDALILQIRTAQAITTAATEIDQGMQTSPGQPPVQQPPGTAPFLPPYTSTAQTGQRILKLTPKPYMTGEDVRAWQQVLRAAGYLNVVADGVFGPATDAATIDWQTKRNLTPDGDVGPATRAKIGTPPTAPVAVPTNASPRPDPAPKTALEVSAEALNAHLSALQTKFGVTGSKGKQDTTLVKRFQTAAGGTADGLPGPGTLTAMARAGQGVLPAVMYWSKSATKTKDLPAYRNGLVTLAAAARARGNPTLAAQLEASAARETGAGGLK